MALAELVGACLAFPKEGTSKMKIFEQIQLLAQRQNDGPSVFLFIIELLVIVLVIAGMWKTFAKAGKPGWASIVPIYNVIVLLEIAGRPLW